MNKTQETPSRFGENEVKAIIAVAIMLLGAPVADWLLTLVGL